MTTNNKMVIADNKRIDKLKEAVSNTIVRITQAIKEEYEKLFSSFQIASLSELMSANNKKRWLLEKYLAERKIVPAGVNVNHLDVMEPDFSPLLNYIHRYNSTLNVHNLGYFISDISELYSAGTDSFELLPNGAVMKRIMEIYSFEIRTAAENIFANELTEMAKIYSKFVNVYNAVTINQIPYNLFTFKIKQDGMIEISPKVEVLKSFRKINR